MKPSGSENVEICHSPSMRLSENFGAIISTGSFVGFPPEKRFY
jgi:hypothetical protein